MGAALRGRERISRPDATRISRAHVVFALHNDHVHANVRPAEELHEPRLDGGGHAEETWRGMMSEQYAAEMAQAGGIGIADQMVAALIEMQAAENSAPQLSSMGAYR